MANRAGDLVERANAILRIVEGGDELQVTHVGREHQLAQRMQAVDRLFEGASLKAEVPSRCSTNRW